MFQWHTSKNQVCHWGGMMSIRQLLKKNPVIASVKSNEGLEKALASNCKIIFILFGTICDIGRIVQKVKQSGKLAFIHIDLLEGASNEAVVVEFLNMSTEVDGIISTKAHMVKAAKALGLYGIQRFFLVDSISYHNIGKHVAKSKPDCIEVMPGLMPSVIAWIKQTITTPIISGGMICDQNTALIALEAGVEAVSSTNEEVWKISSQKAALMAVLSNKR